MDDPSFPASFASVARGAVDRRITKNIMTSPLLLCSITPFCFLAAWGFKEKEAISIGLLLLGALPIFLSIIAYVYFGLTNPHFLLTEDYQIRQAALGVLESKGGKITLDPASLVAIANPELKQSQPDEEGK